MCQSSIAFEPVLSNQGTDEFFARYVAEVREHGVIGCYMQTELGHGSNVSALETTATYVPETQEFEIHSPTLTSTKWWIGAAGKLATHGVVQAKLILPDGRDAGPNLFYVQLRSLGQSACPSRLWTVHLISHWQMTTPFCRAGTSAT